MSEKIKGFTIALEKDISIDDIEYVKTALKMVKGVANVTESLSDINDHINREQIRYEFREKFLRFYKDHLTND